MSMNEMIKEIEAATRNPVYVGMLAGTDLKSIWACVTDRRGYSLQVPAATSEEAVAGLYERVMQ